MDKHQPSFDRPDIVYSLHQFDSAYYKIGPGHRRQGHTYDVTSDGVGTPLGIVLYDGEYIRTFWTASGEFYDSTSEVFSWGGDQTYYDFAVIDDLLVVSNGSEIKAYDKLNPSWGLQQLGNDAPELIHGVTSDLTATTSGSMEAGTYYYAFTFEDAWQYEGRPSDSMSITLLSGETAVSLSNIPLHTSEYKGLYTNIYRTYCDNIGTEYDGVYHLVAQVSSDTFTDTLNDANLTETMRYGLEWGSDYGKKPEGKNLKVWGQRLTWSNGNYICISTIDDYGNPNPGVMQVRYKIGDDSDIIQTCTDGDDLIIFKTNGIWKMQRYSYNINNLTTEFGIRSKRHAIEWMGTVAFISGDTVYSLSPFKEIGRDISPLFTEYTSPTTTPFMMVDHQNRLYISATVYSNTNPTWSTPKYVTYVTDGHSWTRVINLDWVYMLADTVNNKTVGLDKRGYLEALTADAHEKTYVPYLTGTPTFSATNKVIVSNIDYIQLGDYVWYYSALSKLVYCSEITGISTLLGIHTVTVAENIFAPADGDIVGIGTIYFLQSGPIYDDKGTVVACRGIRMIATGLGGNSYLGFGYNSTSSMKSATLSYDKSELMLIEGHKQSWYLYPALSGIVQGTIEIMIAKLDLDKAGTKR